MYFNNISDLSIAIKQITSDLVEIYFGSGELIFSTAPSSTMPSQHHVIPVITPNGTYFIHTAANQDDRIKLDCLKGLVKRFLNLSPSIDPDHQLWRNDNLRLINLLCGNESASDIEIKNLSMRLNYKHDTSRYAIIFQFKAVLSTFERISKTAFQEFFLDTVQTELNLDTQDIYSFSGSEKFILFKQSDAATQKERKEALSRIYERIFSRYGVEVVAGIGKAYSSLPRLNNSYRQALFLICYHMQLNSNPQVALHIDDYFFEYISLLLPRRYINRKYENYSAYAKENPAFHSTLFALINNNHVLNSAAKELGIHRNTLSQHMSALKERLNIDPLYYDDDRFKIKQFHIVSHKKNILSAGVVIQDDSTLHIGYDHFAKRLHENSDGNLMMNVHNVSLSGDNENLIRILRDSSIDFAVVATASLEPYTDSRMSTLNLPFLFRNIRETQRILDGPIGQSFLDLLMPADIVGLGFWSMGWRHITSNKPIRVPSDLSGLKIRIMHNDNMQKFFSSCGAIPIKMKYNLVSHALQQKLIDGEDNPYSNIKSMEFYLHQKYVSEIKHSYDLVTLLMSRQTWDRLDETQRMIIRQSAAEATMQQRKESHHRNYLDKQWLIQNDLLKCVVPTEEELTVWIEKIQPFYDSHPFQNDLRWILSEKTKLGKNSL